MTRPPHSATRDLFTFDLAADYVGQRCYAVFYAASELLCITHYPSGDILSAQVGREATALLVGEAVNKGLV